MSDPSTPTEKLIVCLTAFGCACVAFFAAAVFVIPILLNLLGAIGAPAIAQQAVVFGLLFGSPIVAAIGGLELGANSLTTEA